MSFYKYKARDVKGVSVEGIIEAHSYKDAVSRLNAGGLFPLLIKENKQYTRRSGKVPLKAVFSFARQLSVLVNSGATLVDALFTLQSDQEHSGFAFVMSEIIESVKEGHDFSSALSIYPDIFSPLFVSLIKAGESGGTLGASLARAADILEEELEFRSSLKAMLLYPALITAVGIITVFILLRFIVPKIVSIFDEMGQALPAPTAFVINVSNVFSQYWFVLLAAAAACPVLLRKFGTNDKFKNIVSDIKLKTWMLGDIIKQIEVCNFSKTLGSLLHNGVSVARALKISAQAASTDAFAAAFADVSVRLEKGTPLYKALAEHSLFSRSFVNVIKVGERSGTLDVVLLEVSDEYRKDVTRKLKLLMNILEPAIIMAVGLLVGFVVIAMLLPIFEIDFAF